jgi:DNA-directed RNA polymerase subunit RPC12/RpoP
VKETEIMSLREFSCSDCSESFNLRLPEDTIRADRSKCGDKDDNSHNLERMVQCQNCEHRNTIYYGIDGHPLLMSGDN